MQGKTGFIMPDNRIVLLNYEEVNQFCVDICHLKENYDKWLKFQDGYSYFSSYFDFLILKLNYIFINPLHQEGAYLKSERDKMFIISEKELNTTDYDSISQVTIQKYNGGNYSDIVPCSDQELNIEKINIDDVKLGNVLIDPNGYAIISKSDEKYGSHEITANTILNQLLINNPSLHQLFDSKQYTVSFLIEQFGFLRTVNYDDYIIIIGYQEILPEILVKIKEKVLGDGVSVFYDITDTGNNLPLKPQVYNIGQRNERIR